MDMKNLALAYAETKLKEYQISKRDAITNGYTDFDKEELQYFQSAYVFALKNLNFSE